MYKITKIISYLIRQFWLPNPFLNMCEPGVAEIVNWLAGGVLVKLAYWLTGTWYDSEDEFPLIGCVGFLVNYTILNYLLLLISEIVPIFIVAIIIFLIVYVLLLVIEYKLFNGNQHVF